MPAGLIQMQVVGDQRSWMVIALDNLGNIWVGTPTPTGRDQYKIRWTRSEQEIA